MAAALDTLVGYFQECDGFVHTICGGILRHKEHQVILIQVFYILFHLGGTLWPQPCLAIG